MAGYVVLGTVTALFSLLPLRNTNRRPCFSETVSQIFVIAYFVFLAIWASLRGNITADAPGYIRQYNNIINNINVNFEYVYLFFCRLSDFLFHDYQGFIIMTSVLLVLSLYFAGVELSENIQYSVILLFLFDLFFRGINQIRQYTGEAFFLIGLCFFFKRKYVLSLFFTLIASMTHSVCFLLFAIFPLSKIHISKKTYIAILLISPFFMYAIRDITFFLFSVINNGQFSRYISGGIYDIKRKLIQPLLKTWGLSFFYLMIWDNVRKEDKCNVFINCSLIASVMAVMGAMSSEIVRVVELFLFPQIFFIPSIVKYIRRDRLLYIIWGIYLVGLFFLLFVYAIYFGIMRNPYYISPFFIIH